MQLLRALYFTEYLPYILIFWSICIGSPIMDVINRNMWLCLNKGGSLFLF